MPEGAASKPARNRAAPLSIANAAKVASPIAPTRVRSNGGRITRVARRLYVMAKGSIIEEGALEGLDIEQLHKHIAAYGFLRAF